MEKDTDVAYLFYTHYAKLIKYGLLYNLNVSKITV